MGRAVGGVLVFFIDPDFHQDDSSAGVGWLAVLGCADTSYCFEVLNRVQDDGVRCGARLVQDERFSLTLILFCVSRARDRITRLRVAGLVCSGRAFALGRVMSATRP